MSEQLPHPARVPWWRRWMHPDVLINVVRRRVGSFLYLFGFGNWAVIVVRTDDPTTSVARPAPPAVDPKWRTRHKG